MNQVPCELERHSSDSYEIKNKLKKKSNLVQQNLIGFHRPPNKDPVL